MPGQSKCLHGELINMDFIPTNPKEKDFVTFKSYISYYWAEKEGLKPNTAREVDLTDDRFRKLVEWQQEAGRTGEYKNKFVRISNEPHKTFFDRPIQHICFWKNLVIISWRHT